MTLGLGGRIRKLREQRGLSQSALAATLPVTSSYVHLLESGARQPSERVLGLLALRLDTTSEYLRTGRTEEVGDIERQIELARSALRAGDAVLAREGFAAALHRANEVGCDELSHAALYGRCLADERLGRLDEAIEGWAALADEPQLAGAVSRARVAGTLIHTYAGRGDLDVAVSVGERMLAREEAAGNSLASDEVARLASSLLGCYYERGDLTRGRLLARRLVAATERCGSKLATASAYWNAGMIAAAGRELADATRFTEAALVLFEELGDKRATASLRLNLAWLDIESGNPDCERTAALIRRAIAQLRSAGSVVDVASAETELARCELLAGRPSQAAAIATTALERLAPGPRLEAANARAVLGRAQLAMGDKQAAVDSYTAAAEHLARIGANRHSARVWRDMADSLDAAGLAAEAVAAYRKAVRLAVSTVR